jgi:hypothetical protein
LLFLIIAQDQIEIGARNLYYGSMTEHYQEMPGHMEREEYSLPDELREAADKIEQRAVKSESDWKDAKRKANLLRIAAERVPELEKAGYFVDVNFDSQDFTGAESNPYQIDILIGDGREQTELFSTAKAKDEPADFSPLFNAAVKGALAKKVIMFPGEKAA